MIKVDLGEAYGNFKCEPDDEMFFKSPLERMGSNYDRLCDEGNGKTRKTLVQDNLWREKADEKEIVEVGSAERRCRRG